MSTKEQLPGVGHIDPFKDAIDQASTAIEGMPSDAYAPSLQPKLRAVVTALATVRRVCWKANDDLLTQFSGAANVVQAQMESAAGAVSTSGWGMGSDRESAQRTASADQWRESKAIVANKVLANLDTVAGAAAKELATAIDAAAAAVDLASKTSVGPISLRPGWSVRDSEKVDDLEREILQAGMVWAVGWFDSVVTAGTARERRLWRFVEAAQRVIRTVQSEPAPVRNARLPSQGSEVSGKELEASYELSRMLSNWAAAHQPRSIGVARDALTSLVAVATDLCGQGGNIAGMRAADFERQFMTPGSQKKVTGFQVKSGWLAQWLPVKDGGDLPGYSPVAGRSSGGVPYRFPAGQS